MAKRNTPRQPMVSSLSLTFKKSAGLIEDVKEAKIGHREKLTTLVEQYMLDVQDGKAEGIRTAKELVEVMKMDLLLMGEATDRTESNTTLDEVKIQKVQQALDVDDPNVQNIMDSVMKALNDANDDEDTSL